MGPSTSECVAVPSDSMDESRTMVIGWNGSREHMSFMYVHRIEMGMSPHERVTSRSGPHAVEVIWKMGYGYLSMMHRYLTRREGRQTTGNVSLSNEAWSWRQMDCGGVLLPRTYSTQAPINLHKYGDLQTAHLISRAECSSHRRKRSTRCVHGSSWP